MTLREFELWLRYRHQIHHFWLFSKKFLIWSWSWVTRSVFQERCFVHTWYTKWRSQGGGGDGGRREAILAERLHFKCNGPVTRVRCSSWSNWPFCKILYLSTKGRTKFYIYIHIEFCTSLARFSDKKVSQNPGQILRSLRNFWSGCRGPVWNKFVSVREA